MNVICQTNEIDEVKNSKISVSLMQVSNSKQVM